MKKINLYQVEAFDKVVALVTATDIEQAVIVYQVAGGKTDIQYLEIDLLVYNFPQEIRVIYN